jgi:hypothetical protein
LQLTHFHSIFRISDYLLLYDWVRICY